MSDFFLPEALMLKIWLNLSIKSTVRFRCVSESWCAALSDPHFIYKNLTFSAAANDNEHDDLLLLVNVESPHYSVVSHATLSATPLLQVPPDVPVPYPIFDPHVLTPPLDDLVCFYHYFESYTGVWNLTTGETRVCKNDLAYNIITLGFGFDEKTKVYKIVKILYPNINLFEAYVYTLSSSNNNYWRKVGEPSFPYSDYDGPHIGYSRTYRDGTFYWGSGDLIVSFDMSTEVFNYISVPPPLGHIQEICKVKEGSMFIIIGAWDSKNSVREYEIWALLELGVTQSWTKLLTIDRGCCVDDTPMGFWRSELVLQSSSNGRLLITNPFKLEIKEVQIDEPHNISRCLAWTKGENTCSRKWIEVD